MSRATFVAALACVALAVVACHDDSKPTAVPLPESTASGVASVSAPPVLAVPPAEIVIETTQITARGAKILDLPSDRSGGADPKDKRSGKNDLFLVPLAAAYPLDGGRIERSTTIDVDDTTPYRMLLEVLFTLGQLEFSHWDLRRRGYAEVLPITPPRPADPTAPGPTGLSLSVVALDAGISVKARGANLGPGCDAIGSGVAVPKRDGVQDLAALGACIRKLKAQSPAEHVVTFSATNATPFMDVWATIDVVRGEKRDLFPDVQLALWR